MLRLALSFSCATLLLAVSARAQEAPPAEPAPAPDNAKPNETAPGGTTIAPPPGAPGTDIKLDDWDRDDWTLVKPSIQLFEMHGYFRVRGDLMRRLDFGNQAGTEANDSGTGAGNNLVSRYPNSSSDNASFTQTNMRMRLEPSINVGEKVSLLSTIDVLDNIGFGSTPSTLPFGSDSSRASTPNNFLNDRQLSPVTDLNALADSIRVKRLYARITALNEQLEVKIGRMPNHWGMGVMFNSGDCLDCDFGMNVDRVQATLRLGGLLITPLMDWVSSGPVYQGFYRYDGQPLDAVTYDDVPEYGVRIQHLTHPDDIREQVAQGNTVFDYGVHNSFRRQSADLNATNYSDTVAEFDPARLVIPDDDGAGSTARETRGAILYTGNAYMKLYSGPVELSAEGGVRAGRLRDTSTSTDGSLQTTSIMQLGGALELKFWPDDRRRGPLLMLRGGAASGDSFPGWGALDKAGTQRGQRPDGSSFDRSLTNFNFSPDYHVDLLTFRRVIGGVTDAWYAAPEVRYFFNDAVEGRLRGIYSQTFFRGTTPGGALPMALEFNGEVHMGAPPEGETTGLRGVLQGGIAFPFGAFRSQDDIGPKFAWTLQYRLYVTF
ncbi:MAG: TIGR04551 family protein [Myxococcota bacterium]